MAWTADSRQSGQNRLYQNRWWSVENGWKQAGQARAAIKTFTAGATTLKKSERVGLQLFCWLLTGLRAASPEATGVTPVSRANLETAVMEAQLPCARSAISR